MGREQYLKSYKKKGIVFLALGILVELIGVLMLLVAITKMMETTAIVLFALIVIIGAGMSYLGFEFVRGEKCRFIKAENLELADDLLATKRYEDKFVIISEKAIALKKDITKIAAIADVLGIYEQIDKQNGITVSHVIKLELRNGKSLDVNVYARKKDTKEDIMLTISHFCPNAMVGHTSEMLTYVQAQRKAYKMGGTINV